MIRKTRSGQRGEELIRQNELPGVSEIVGDVHFGVLRIGEIVTILVSTWNPIELIHSTAIYRQYGALKGMTDIARKHVWCVAQRYGLASRYRSGRGPICPREGSKVVVVRAVLFDQKNDMFDFS